MTVGSMCIIVNKHKNPHSSFTLGFHNLPHRSIGVENWRDVYPPGGLGPDLDANAYQLCTLHQIEAHKPDGIRIKEGPP